MNSSTLLIVFAKNAQFGKVKTRLAATIGDQQALEVYHYLFASTEQIVQQLGSCDVHIYFSDRIEQETYTGRPKFVQQGSDLGERMGQAFAASFDSGYRRVLGIGTDLPDLSVELIQDAVQALQSNDVVFGPADDGGYYLLGMNKYYSYIFEDKAWSTQYLLQSTLDELTEQQRTVHLLESKNDIDTYEDFAESILPERMPHIKPIG